jgi:hypothetical protein
MSGVVFMSDENVRKMAVWAKDKAKGVKDVYFKDK